MALLICSECEGKVSSLAASCPHCGAPVPKVGVDPTPAPAVRATPDISPAPRPAPAQPPLDRPIPSETVGAAQSASARAATEPTAVKAGSATKQPLPLNVPLRTYRSPKRAVSVPLLLGILFLPFIFAWFLLQKGYSTVSRVAGFAWLLFVVFIVWGLLRLASDLFWNSPADPNLAANGTTTTQIIDPNQVPVTQQPLRPLVLPSAQPQNNVNLTPQQPQDFNNQQFQGAQDPVQFNTSPPPQSINNAADAAANSSTPDPVNPFNDTRPIHRDESPVTQ